jgi:hypothetical protein
MSNALIMHFSGEVPPDVLAVLRERLDLTSLNSPPSAEDLAQTLSSIRAAVAESGFNIDQVGRQPPIALRDGG